MSETGNLRNLERRVGDVETQVGKHDVRLDAQGRELGEIKEAAEKTDTKIDGVTAAIGNVDKSQVAMSAKVDQLLEFRQDARGVVISLASKLFIAVGGILTLLALAILVAIELARS